MLLIDGMKLSSLVDFFFKGFIYITFFAIIG